MTGVIPCHLNERLTAQVEEFAEALKIKAHKIGKHGLTEQEFYDSGMFRAAVERIRGQVSASMTTKREFVARVLEHMQDRDHIREWNSSAGGKNRYDYTVTLKTGRIAVIELKGCLDGNNTPLSRST